MQLKMAKSLLLLFSLILITFSCGCSDIYPKPIVIVSSPKLVYPEYNTSIPFTIKAKKENGKIVMSISEFSRITTKLIKQKYEIKILQSIIKIGNNFNPNVLQK